MKKQLFIIAFFVANYTLFAQRQPLKDLVQLALQNTKILQAVRYDSEVASLATREQQALWWPQISLAYHYRYNAIVPTTILPIGQFNTQNPTNTTEGIKMGTKWQQTGGVNFSQPLVDFTIRYKRQQTRWDERIAQVEVIQKSDEVIFEVVNSYLTIALYQELMHYAQRDTARTALTLLQQQRMYDQQQLLYSDLNRARVNHNTAIISLRERATDLVTERIYLAYLVGIQESDLPVITYTESMDLFASPEHVRLEERPEVLILSYQRESIASQIKFQKSKRLPTFALEAYLGGNQYAEQLSPFQEGTWFGSSYVGVALSLPILWGENTSLRNQQLRKQMASTQLRQSDLIDSYKQQLARLEAQIAQLSGDVELLNQNVVLQQEILRLLSIRLSEQQATPFEVNIEEIEWQKMLDLLLQKQLSLLRTQLQRLRIGGNISKMFL